jgi:prefoldin subunit 5
MKPASIITIENNLFDTSDLLSVIKNQGYTIDQTFGPEGEYTLKGLVEGVKSVVSDLKFLTNHGNIFIRLSTNVERTNLAANLQNLKAYLDSSNFTYVITHLEALKTVLRQYNLRTNKEYFAEFHQQYDLLKIRYSEIEDFLATVKSSTELADESRIGIESSKVAFDESLKLYNDNLDVFDKKIGELKETITEADVTLENIEEIEEKSAGYLSLIETHKTTILDFLAKITEREKDLDKQNSLSKDYETKINNYTEEQSKIVKEAKGLIESAKKALEYKTAEGMSAAFQEKHTKAVEGKVLIGWVVGAILFVIAALSIGICFLIIEKHDLYSLIGRLSLMSLCVVAATFCATQYTKQKNLIEDYAYKTVLSKSFIAFAEELKKHDEADYGSMVQNILKEILQDPLRQREKTRELNLSSINSKDLESLANAISKITGSGK